MCRDFDEQMRPSLVRQAFVPRPRLIDDLNDKQDDDDDDDRFVRAVD